ncbi:MAG TPA: glycosyltransferase family 2 protein [Chryseobacterium sp.]|nr:glycosyltransferase family 2 protein [Chryseobacterium sp.]
MKSIAILITVHNRKAKTLQCLEHLFVQQAVESYYWEVFLTDDGCTDGTVEAVANQYPSVHIVQGDGTLFWNRGMHRAWQAAVQTKDYDYYLWLNDDVTLFKDAIYEALECDIICCGKSIICGALSSSINFESFTYGGKTLDGNYVIPNGNIQNCSIINGNFVLVNKNICNNVGILDPIYPHAIGDHEYGLRAIKYGFSVVTTRKYIGNCETNKLPPKWCRNDVNIFERCKSLYSPLGYCPPKFYFIYETKYFGFHVALKHFISIHLRLLMPSIWLK